MREIQGNLWSYFRRPEYVLCITVNGTVKRNGEAVMGRGCAREAKDLIPGIAKILGFNIQRFGGLRVFGFKACEANHILFFPVKWNWWEEADLNLIKRSAEQLEKIAQRETDKIFILPRPGCGNGKRRWEEVKPLLEFLPDNVWVITNEKE